MSSFLKVASNRLEVGYGVVWGIAALLNFDLKVCQSLNGFTRRLKFYQPGKREHKKFLEVASNRI